MRLITCLASAALLALASATAGAQPPDPIQDRVDRFGLLTDCSPLILSVDPDPDRPDFTASVTAAVESRLRSARLFIEEDPGYAIGAPALAVSVDRFGTDAIGPYASLISVRKLMFDVFSGETTFAITWQLGKIGRGGDDFILNRLSQGLDQFLAAYLRVNAEACE